VKCKVRSAKEEAREGMKEEGTSLTHPCFPSKEGNVTTDGADTACGLGLRLRCWT
jgi:hypothetical protein